MKTTSPIKYGVANFSDIKLLLIAKSPNEIIKVFSWFFLDNFT